MIHGISPIDPFPGIAVRCFLISRWKLAGSSSTQTECEGLRPQRVLISPVRRLCLLYGTKTELGYGAKPKIGVDDYNGTKGILAPCPGSVSFTEQRLEPGYGAEEKLGTDDDSRTKTKNFVQPPSLDFQVKLTWTTTRRRRRKYFVQQPSVWFLSPLMAVDAVIQQIPIKSLRMTESLARSALW
ncbi:uncharacterized protein [Oscarella lobularis]|uniref:uncharacterized protein n=1 Tax=Oscarella lobularis TaxID=121494 RepID=UPI0033142377